MRCWRFGNREVELWVRGTIFLRWGCGHLRFVNRRYNEFVPLILGYLRSRFGHYGTVGSDCFRGCGEGGICDILEDVDGEGVEEFVG